MNVQVESRRSIPDYASSSSCRYQPVLTSEKLWREGARPQNWLLCGLAVSVSLLDKAWHRNSWRFENNSGFRGPHSQLQRTSFRLPFACLILKPSSLPQPCQRNRRIPLPSFMCQYPARQSFPRPSNHPTPPTKRRTGSAILHNLT